MWHRPLSVCVSGPCLAYAAKIIGKFKLNKYFISGVQWTWQQFAAAAPSYPPCMVVICHHYQPMVVHFVALSPSAFVAVKPLNVMAAIYMARA